MFFKQLTRYLHTTRCIYATDKSALGTLRKKTGYTFANCKKALELHNNDLAKAEQWLKEQAQSLGWSKATKLEGRSTKQGLVGVLIQNNIGAMVEINCETDFVARNKTFQQFVESVSQACVQHVVNMPTNDVLSKIDFDGETLKQITLHDGKCLGDHLALMIGSVGENASLRRATCFKATNSIVLSGFTHPAPTPAPQNNVQLGKYGAIIASHNKSDTTVTGDVQKNLCQHIVGLNPSKIGAQDLDKPAENKDDEVCLIYQEYLLDPTLTVNDVLQENQIEIVNFERYECGEQLKETGEHVVAAATN